jgi:hypothetical protein
MNKFKEVLLGEQTPEEFTIKLREVTKSQDKGNLLPFLKRALPNLRKSIQNGEHTDLLESLSLDNGASSTTVLIRNINLFNFLFSLLNLINRSLFLINSRIVMEEQRRKMNLSMKIMRKNRF